MNDTPLSFWPDRLEELATSLHVVNSVTVITETDSTQDAMRRAGAQVGALVCAGRQSSGRGQRGRSWNDERGEGIALSLGLPSAAPSVSCARAAVALFNAFAEPISERGFVCGIKWPNDFCVVTDGLRKLAGVLVEDTGDCAVTGIGLNVLQREWREPLDGHAISLAQLGVEIDRLAALERILVGLDRACALENEDLRRAFVSADVLRNVQVVVQCGAEQHTGKLLESDPFDGLLIETDAGQQRLDPAHSKILTWSGSGEPMNQP